MAGYNNAFEGAIGEAQRLDKSDIETLNVYVQHIVNYLLLHPIINKCHDFIASALKTHYFKDIHNIQTLSRGNKALEGLRAYLMQIINDKDKK